jgi:hypothetical protein
MENKLKEIRISLPKEFEFVQKIRVGETLIININFVGGSNHHA